MSEPTRRSTIDVSLLSNFVHILLITDGAGAQLQLGDYTFIGDLRRDENGELSWGRVQGGHVNVNALYPREDRPFLVWQITVRGLLALGLIDLGYIFEQQFGVRPEQLSQMRFEVVAVHAGADFISGTIYDTSSAVPELNVTPRMLRERLEELIIEQTNDLPGNPDVVWIGVASPGGYHLQSDNGISDDMTLTRHDAGNRGHWSYVDKVLVHTMVRLHRERATEGRFPAAPVVVHGRTRLRCFFAGSAVHRGRSNGRGYPFAADLPNAGRILWGAMMGAVRKLGRDCGGLGYFSFRYPAQLGHVAHWTESLEVEPPRPGQIRSFGEVTRIPAHLFLCHGGEVVSN